MYVFIDCYKNEVQDLNPDITPVSFFAEFTHKVEVGDKISFDSLVSAHSETFQDQGYGQVAAGELAEEGLEWFKAHGGGIVKRWFWEFHSEHGMVQNIVLVPYGS